MPRGQSYYWDTDPLRCLHLLKCNTFFYLLCSNSARHGIIQLLFDCFLKMGQPRPLFCLFLIFSNKQYFFTKYQCEKFPSTIQRQDSNPQPLEHESSPITSRPRPYNCLSHRSRCAALVWPLPGLAARRCRCRCRWQWPSQGRGSC